MVLLIAKKLLHFSRHLGLHLISNLVPLINAVARQVQATVFEDVGWIELLGKAGDDGVGVLWDRRGNDGPSSLGKGVVVRVRVGFERRQGSVLGDVEVGLVVEGLEGETVVGGGGDEDEASGPEVTGARHW